MTDLQPSTMLFYFAGALLLSAGGLIAVGAFVGFNRQFGKWTVALINPLVLCAMCAIAVFSNRNISNAEFEIATAAGAETAMLVWTLRGVTMVVLGICLARFISTSQSHETRMRTGRGLFVAFLAFYVSNFVLNNIFGTRPAFDQKLIYPLLAVIAVYLSRGRDVRYTVDATKAGLLVFCIASVGAIHFLPQAAVQQGYASSIPGIGFRLWGLGSNPNSTGPLALILLLLLVWRPYRNRLLQILGYVSGAAVLVLCQSKTAWLAALIAFPTLWWGKVLYAASVRGMSRHSAYTVKSFSRPILLCLLGLAAVAAVAYMQMHDTLNTVAQDQQVTTLTGRTDIWAVALETWQKSPIFGYGSAMWDDEFRRAIGMDFAYNAHNQFLQSLSVAGALGLAGLLIYTLALFRYAYAANTATRGLSLALFWLIFIRFFTEAPFNMAGLFSGEFVTHLLLFTLILTKGKSIRTASVPAPAYDGLQHLQWR